MTYQEALEYIHSVCWKGSVPGLSRITELCSRLGDPQKNLRFVHVAGTNGKGSVSSMIASVLTAAGYRTGLFTSPYLVDFCERMSVDGCDISHDDLCESVERLRPAASSMEDCPTEFELITAVAFDYFAHAGCDIVVLECGMGGRLDSTNVIDPPEAAVITNIALDHTSFLGDTEEKIAAEKAGIIKAGCPVILGESSDSVADVVEEKCCETGANLVLAGDKELCHVKLSREGLFFTADGRELFVPLCGLYQEKNVKCVLCAVDVLRERGFDISDAALERGLSAVTWRGRFETLRRDPVIIFDGAHNPDGAAYTALTYKTLYPDCPAVLVCGVMADKDAAEMVRSLSTVATRAFCIQPDNPRAMDAEELAGIFCRFGVAAEGCSDAREAVGRAAAAAKEIGGVVLCAGSLYMYGEIAGAVGDLEP